MRTYRFLLVTATLLAFGVVALGAYVRLSDAGLGCPDWPGCYGHLIGVPDAPHEQAAAAAAFPGRQLEAPKAWKEMIHRYFAGTLGLLIATIAGFAWRSRQRLNQSPALPTALGVLVVAQALFGMWTVTLRLRPAIVSTHLLGGMTTLALLVWLTLLQTRQAAAVSTYPRLRRWAVLALAAVAVQIALGGWVSSNYAALACPDFPTCQGEWLPKMDFGHAFEFNRELGETAAGGLLPLTALTAIHWTHRIGALVVTLIVGGLALALLRRPEERGAGALLAVALGLQVGLGIANVLLSLPLPVAVTHNAGAALLLATLVGINWRLRPIPALRRQDGLDAGRPAEDRISTRPQTAVTAPAEAGHR